MPPHRPIAAPRKANTNQYPRHRIRIPDERPFSARCGAAIKRNSVPARDPIGLRARNVNVLPHQRCVIECSSGIELATNIIGMVRRPFLEKAHEIGIGRVGQGDAQLHILVAGAGSRRNALALETQRRATIRAARHLDGDRTVDRRHRDGRTEHGLDQGDRNVDMDIELLAREERVRLDLDFEVGVALRAAQTQLLAILDAGRNRHVERAAIGQGDAMLAAARRLEKRDEQMLRRTLGLGFGLTRAAPPAIEKFGDDIVEAAKGLGTGALIAACATTAAESAEAAAESTARAGTRATIVEATHALGAVRTDLAAVIPCTLLRIREEIVSGGDFLELLLDRALPGIDVG